MSEKNKPLNKPTRTPGGPKKFTVYVKDNGKTKKVNFGDPNMEIKRDSPERRKNYRARHHCENPGPKTKANYWSCKMWSKKPVSKITSSLDSMFVKIALLASKFDSNNFTKEADALDNIITVIAKKMKNNPCWKNYEMIGLKPNGDPNCVPKKSKKKK